MTEREKGFFVCGFACGLKARRRYPNRLETEMVTAVKDALYQWWRDLIPLQGEAAIELDLGGYRGEEMQKMAREAKNRGF